MTEVTSEWITLEDAAITASVHEATVRRAIARGDLPAYRVGRSLRIRREDLPLMFRAIPAAGAKYDGGAA